MNSKQPWEFKTKMTDQYKMEVEAIPNPEPLRERIFQIAKGLQEQITNYEILMSLKILNEADLLQLQKLVNEEVGLRNLNGN